jgi:hypothetical protein
VFCIWVIPILDLFRLSPNVVVREISSVGFSISAAPAGEPLYNCRGSSTNRPFFLQNKANFTEAKMSVNISLTRNYDNNPALPLPQNKPKQSQFHRKPRMNVSSVLTRNYEEKTNEPFSEYKAKQTQFKPEAHLPPRGRQSLRVSFLESSNRGPNKVNVGSLGNLFDHIEILVLKTKLKILILQDRLDILLINEALRLIR